MSFLSPYLSLPPLYAVIIMAFLVSLAINIAYKYLTDQKLMKKLKDEISDIQKKSKELPPDKALSLQKKALEVNMEYLKHSLKPTLFTMIPVLLVFMWMSSHYSFAAIHPQTEFEITLITEQGAKGTLIMKEQEGIEIIGTKTQEINNNNATYKLKGQTGTYLVEWEMNTKTYQKDIIIAEEQTYAEAEKIIKDGQIEKIRIDYKKNQLMDLLGWKVGWLGTYIIFSIIFSLTLRKVMNLY